MQKVGTEEKLGQHVKEAIDQVFLYRNAKPGRYGYGMPAVDNERYSHGRFHQIDIPHDAFPSDLDSGTSLRQLSGVRIFEDTRGDNPVFRIEEVIHSIQTDQEIAGLHSSRADTRVVFEIDASGAVTTLIPGDWIMHLADEVTSARQDHREQFERHINGARRPLREDEQISTYLAALREVT